MGLIQAGARESHTLPADRVLIVACTGVVRLWGLPESVGSGQAVLLATLTGGTNVYGPFLTTQRYEVECVSGHVDVSTGSADRGVAEEGVARGLTVEQAARLRALLPASSLPATVPTAPQVSALTSWFPLQEGAGSTVADVLNPGLIGTINGTLGSQWGSLPGVTFNGTDNAITVPGSAANLHREILNLSTLNGADQILVWLVLSHTTTIPGAALFWWGLQSVSGWGFHTLGSNNFVQWRDRPVGSSNFTQTALQNQRRACDLRGQAGTNTRTAIALTIEASPSTQQYEVSVSKASILVPASTIGQQDHMLQTVPFLPNGGTARTSYDAAAGLTIGAAATSSQANRAAFLPASHAIVNFGMQRRSAATGGFAVTVARALAKAPLAFPAPARV